jgi:hypothetical protein
MSPLSQGRQLPPPTNSDKLSDKILTRFVDAAFEQELLYVAVAQREAIIEPDSMADDLAGKAVVLIACRGSGWSHVGYLS